MSVKAIVDKVQAELRQHGLDIQFKVREGGWIHPSSIEFEHDGKPHHLQVWDGQVPSNNEKTVAERIYEDVLTVVTASPARR